MIRFKQYVLHINVKTMRFIKNVQYITLNIIHFIANVFGKMFYHERFITYLSLNTFYKKLKR